MKWEISLTGLVIGLLVGITGMGGGSLMTPILILVFGFKPTLAVGTDILHGAVFKSFGADVAPRRADRRVASGPVRRRRRVDVREGDRRRARPGRARLPREDVRQP